MIRKGRALVLMLLLMIGTVLPGWVFPSFGLSQRVHGSEPEAQVQIRHLIEEKQNAVNQRERERFLRLLHPDMKTYIQEQKRWFDDTVQWIDPGSYRLRVISMIPWAEHQIRVWMEQCYTRKGKRFTLKYPVLFQETAAGWRDADFPLHHLTRGDVTVRYSDTGLAEQAAIALETGHKAIQELKRKMGWMPKRPVEVKIYHRPEWFRQSVKLSLPRWAGGWHEAGESIKLIGARGVEDRQLVSSGIVHEVTHLMVSEMTGDNAAYWLQEGAAEYFQSHLLPGLHSREESSGERPRWSLSQLKKANLEQMGEKEAAAYYTQCYQLFRFLMETYGEEKVKRLFSVLQLSPEEDRDIVGKLSLTNRRTEAALKKVLGKSLKELEKDWLQHLKKEKRKDSPHPPDQKMDPFTWSF
ncbi:peptidase MA family metallohydrolase [Kroppenstedtia eburnea]|uniref:Peptidase MA-like domain-containing protein n=1 Tax=Kroppenstedtia eburnea TaxID=714067 RepID=A0A1N7PV61_9BACL|nr:hypothetical protein [Kroppenstedtia eburnea]QKI80938.1 hypothetical protein GXN75_02390 [Kroppenstedtia eburnea]SIT14543.1 hypothetical protein SAMN05421790_1151 [Kroppenstedtia eburnea]